MVAIITDGKTEGFGEGVLYKSTTLSAIRFYKKEIHPYLEKKAFENIKQAREIISRNFSLRNPGLVCAIDLALWDLEAKQKNMTLFKLLGSSAKNIEITEELFMDQFDNESIQKIINRGTKNLKVKVGKDFVQKGEKLKNLIKKINLRIRGDANRFFTMQEYSNLQKIFSDLKIHEIEEPVQKKYLPKIKNKDNIILDESIMDENDLDRTIKMGFKIFNIKLARIGGITKSLEFIKKIESKNLKTIIGSSEELGIASFGIFSLASSTKNLHSVEGLGSQRLKFDIIEPEFAIEKGKVRIPNSIYFKETKLMDAARKFKFKVSINGQITFGFLLYEISQDIIGKFKNLWIRIKP